MEVFNLSLSRIAGPNLMLPLKTEELLVFLTQEVYRLGRQLKTTLIRHYLMFPFLVNGLLNS